MTVVWYLIVAPQLMAVVFLASAQDCCVETVDQDCASGEVCADSPTTCGPESGEYGYCREDTTGSSSAGCFPQNALLNVLGKGPTAMKDLVVGVDKVFTGDVYETVYAMGHLDETFVANFVEIQTKTTALRATEDHLIALLLPDEESGKYKRFVPAKSLKVGHALSAGNITSIRLVQDTGLYAPMTASGTLEVNGIQTSCYVSMQQGFPEYFELAANRRMNALSQHMLSHFGMSPVRWLCLGVSQTLCSNGLTIDSSDGYAWFTKIALRIVGVVESFSEKECIQIVLLAVLSLGFGVFWIMECMLGAIYAPTCFASLAVLGIMYYKGLRYAKPYKQKKEI